MASVNKVILVGNLGRDPEVRYSEQGTAIANISIATTSAWKDKTSGEKREETEWHRVVFYNRLAEIVGEYLKSGHSVYIEGRLKTRKWQDKDTGADRYSTDVVADHMQMLGGSRGNDGDRTQSSQAGNSQRRNTNAAPPQRAPATANAGYDSEPMSDDIPF